MKNLQNSYNTLVEEVSLNLKLGAKINSRKSHEEVNT